MLCFSIYEKLIQFCAIDELGTNYPKVSRFKRLDWSHLFVDLLLVIKINSFPTSLEAYILFWLGAASYFVAWGEKKEYCQIGAIIGYVSDILYHTKQAPSSPFCHYYELLFLWQGQKKIKDQALEPLLPRICGPL